MSEKTALSLQSDLDPQKGDLDGDAVKRDGFYKESESEKSNSKLSAFLLDVGNVLRIDYSME